MQATAGQFGCQRSGPQRHGRKAVGWWDSDLSLCLSFSPQPHDLDTTDVSKRVAIVSSPWHFLAPFLATGSQVSFLSASPRVRPRSVNAEGGVGWPGQSGGPAPPSGPSDLVSRGEHLGRMMVTAES